MVAFPLVKLFYLGVKQGSKYIANGLKNRAKSSKLFRNCIMVPAQVYHSFDVNVRMKMLGLGKAKHIEKLSETMAVELGANMLGEFIIYGIGAVILYAEYSRSAAKEEMKEQAMIQKDLILEQRLQENSMVIEQLHYKLRELERLVGDLDTRNASLSTRLFGKAKS